FKDCQCVFAQFRFARIRSVLFSHCDLHEADFQGASLKDVVFDDCNLTGVELSGATLSNVDLRSSKIDNMRAGPRELQGAIIEPQQALAFVRGMGIEVKLPHED
ncbi:MAG: pentapeptide repeat-containing protein, partial [Ktedonobacteraceae bacterium]|nr:pentapeptide repeat-containing protein [Ktedonobacteraceae bacterium]